MPAELQNDDDDDVAANNNTTIYQPIVTLPLVELHTNEEDETVLVEMRAKLYRFDSSQVPSEWKERGTGDLKLLRHTDKNTVRVVMRRDKTFKVCANHFVTPWMTLRPCTGSERAFVYTVAADFADEQAKSECLAVKFATVEIATTFRMKFEEAKRIVIEHCPLYNDCAHNCDGPNEECPQNDDDDDDDDDNVDDDELSKRISKLEVSNDEASAAIVEIQECRVKKKIGIDLVVVEEQTEDTTRSIRQQSVPVDTTNDDNDDKTCC